MVTGRKPDLKCVYHAEKGIREVDSRYGDALNLKSMCHYTSASLDMREMHEFEMERGFFVVCLFFFATIHQRTFVIVQTGFTKSSEPNSYI